MDTRFYGPENPAGPQVEQTRSGLGEEDLVRIAAVFAGIADEADMKHLTDSDGPAVGMTPEEIMSDPGVTKVFDLMNGMIDRWLKVPDPMTYTDVMEAFR
jgi:hypothetical protein